MVGPGPLTSWLMRSPYFFGAILAANHLRLSTCSRARCTLTGLSSSILSDSSRISSEAAMTGKNRIMIYGPKGDGTYVIEFRTAAREALAISIPRGETAVIRHFQECMPCRKLAAFIRDCFAGNTAAPEALLQRPPVHPPTKVQGPGTPPQLSPSGGGFLVRRPALGAP